MLDHTALLNEQKEEWQSHAYTVTVEKQNVFRLRGPTALLVIKPDLIVERDDVRAIDVKTGREQAWHTVQVKIYEYAIARARTLPSKTLVPRHQS